MCSLDIMSYIDVIIDLYSTHNSYSTLSPGTFLYIPHTSYKIILPHYIKIEKIILYIPGLILFFGHFIEDN